MNFSQDLEGEFGSCHSLRSKTKTLVQQRTPQAVVDTRLWKACEVGFCDDGRKMAFQTSAGKIAPLSSNWNSTKVN